MIHIRVIIYARYSSDNQRYESITAQIRACREYAERKGYIVVAIYTDEAKTGTNDNRPQFLKMIDDIKGGLVEADILLIHKLDRFARNRYDSAIYRRQLSLCGVRIESVIENFNDSPESSLLESLLEGLNEYYSKNLAREVNKGMKETALQAKHTGGQPPLGYDVTSDGHYVINLNQAESIKLIFEMYANNYSYRDITAELNQRGFKTRSGMPFGNNSLHDILRNPKYSGVYVFNAKTSKTADGRRNNHSLKNPEDIIIIPNAMPALVTQELFDKVQKRMDGHAQQNGRFKAQVVYLLSGLIYCGECGRRMTGTSSSYKTRVSQETRLRYHYECSYAKRTHDCEAKKISKDLVEQYVLKELHEQLLNEETIPLLARKVYEFFIGNQDKTQNETISWNKKIVRIDTQISNLLQAIAEGGGTVRSIVEKIKSLEIEKASVQARLHEFSLRQMQTSITEDKIVNYLLHYQKDLLDDPKVCKRVVEEFVESVIVKKDTIEIAFKVSVVSNGGGGGSRTPVRK